jgi:C-terminal processing protease CtpA/Prc
MKIIDSLHKQDPVGWIIDLRGNTGGIIEYFVSAICQIVDEFEIIGYDEQGKQNSSLTSNGKSFTLRSGDSVIVKVDHPFRISLDFKNIHVLIDKNTASAGEILSFILRKYKKAKIYGESSYGVLSLMNLEHFREFSLVYPFSQLDTGDGLGRIVPDVAEIPKELFPR